jgi:hypothetical protein
MTTTRINHTGHNHPSTTTARTACRKAMKVTAKVTLVDGGRVGRGNAIHISIVATDGSMYGVKCGAGMTRSAMRGNSALTNLGRIDLTTVTCKTCRASYGQAQA